MFCGDLHFHQTLYSSNISSMQANNSLISLRPCACMRCGTSIRSNSNNTSSCIGRWGFPVAVLAWQRVFTITFHSQRGKATIFSKEMGFHYHHLMQKATSNDIFFSPLSSSSMTNRSPSSMIRHGCPRDSSVSLGRATSRRAR